MEATNSHKNKLLANKKLIFTVAGIVVTAILAFFFWPKSINRNYVELSSELIELNKGWAQIPQKLVEIQPDGSILFPASYVIYDKKDSSQSVKRSATLSEEGDSVPYIYNKTEIITTRYIITPGSNRIKIRSKDFVIQGNSILIKPALFLNTGKTFRFFETPAAKLSKIEVAKNESDNTFFYIILLAIVAGVGIWWFFFRYKEPNIMAELKAQGIDLPESELSHYILPGYSSEEIAYLIKTYFGEIKETGMSYADMVKKVIPVPLQDVIQEIDPNDPGYQMMKKAAEHDRKRFEQNIKDWKEFRKMYPSMSYEEAISHKSKGGLMSSDSADNYDLPFNVTMSFKNLTSFRFHMKNIESLGYKLDFKSRLHKYSNPDAIEQLVESFYNLLKAEVKITFDALEKHYLNGGDLKKLENSLILLKNAGMDIPYHYLINRDLSGLDLKEIVPKAIKPAIRKLSYDGIIAPDKEILEVEAELTYRLDLTTYINTAGIETLVARIDEAMHDVIGDMGSSQKAIKNPVAITNQIRKMELDKDTSLSIVSLNITSIKIKKPEEKKKRHSGYHGFGH